MRARLTGHLPDGGGLVSERLELLLPGGGAQLTGADCLLQRLTRDPHLLGVVRRPVQIGARCEAGERW